MRKENTSIIFELFLKNEKEIPHIFSEQFNPVFQIKKCDCLLDNLKLYKNIFKNFKEEIILSIVRLINFEKYINNEVKELLNEPKIILFNKKVNNNFDLIRFKNFIKELTGLVIIIFLV